jgi:hypothetical protein
VEQMDDKSYLFDALKTTYERSLNDANEIIARAQNPLTALSIIIAILLYMVPKVYKLPILSLENAILSLFYLTLAATLISTGLTSYYLIRAFRLGGYNYKTIGSPEQITSLGNEKDPLESLKARYKLAAEININNNRSRLEYISRATETIILAVAFCFFGGLIYCIIISLTGLNG